MTKIADRWSFGLDTGFAAERPREFSRLKDLERILGLLHTRIENSAYLPGEAGGQTLYGGSGSGENLTLGSTSHATKGRIYFGASSAYDEVNDRLGLRTTSPATTAHVVSAGANTVTLRVDTAGSGKLQVSEGATANSVAALFNSSGTETIRLHSGAASFLNGGNLSLFASSGSFGGGTGVLYVANAGTNPSSTPSTGWVLYSDSARAKVREDANRFIVQAVADTKTTAGAPYTNDGYVEVVIGGTTRRIMTTA